MVSQEPAKLSCVLSAVWVRVPVPPPHYMEGSHSLVQCTGPENRRPARVRGFESHPLRHSGSTTAFHCCYWYRDNVDRPIKINTLHLSIVPFPVYPIFQTGNGKQKKFLVESSKLISNNFHIIMKGGDIKCLNVYFVEKI